jgi:hypothetical protein
MSVRRQAALAAVVAVLVGGCSDEPEPRFEEPTSTPTPSESSTTTEPEAQTPEEFIREWVRLDRELQNTGETSEYMAVSSQCRACRDFAERVENVYAGGGRIETKGWRVASVQQLESDRYQLKVESQPTTVTDGSGETEEFEGGRATYELTLRRTADGWQITEWVEVAA